MRAFYYGWYAEVLTGLPPLANGQITVPVGPGIGVELRPDVLERPDCHRRMTRAGDV